MARGKPKKVLKNKRSYKHHTIKPARSKKELQKVEEIKAERVDGDELEEDQDGLLPKWIEFIEEYMKNGFNGTKAYFKVYNVKNKDVARSCAARLLSYVSVNKEIQYRLNAKRITEDAVLAETWDIATDPSLRTEKGAGSQVSALTMLAKTKGMVTDVKKHQFDVENPAVFVPHYTAEEKKEMDKLIAEGGKRIIE